jgi:D-serine deaminase-like pyridoxal phosphate-dependent protein
MNQKNTSLDTPCIVIDESIVRQNIQNMVKGLRSCGIAHRPHFKTHKSLRYARLQLEMGAVGITCASLGEAEALVDGGITDLFIAYPIIGDIKIKRLMRLSRRADLRTAVNSPEGAQRLGEAFATNDASIKVLIELDGGMNRSGITLGNIADFAKTINQLPGLNIIGVMTYRGNIYGMTGEAEYAADTKKEAESLLEAQRILRNAGIEAAVLSGGSSFSGKFPQYLRGIGEARAGTYIFNDVSQLSTGMVDKNDCALTVLATVVTRPDETHAVIDAGSKALSSDLTKYHEGYGYVIEYPGAVIYKLSEEHGYLRLPEGTDLKVGDQIRIVPNHVCAAVNLADSVWSWDGGIYTEQRVDARGLSR